MPTVGMDYAFPEGSPRGVDEDDNKRGMTVLVMKEDRYGVTFCMVVPKKGASYKGIVGRILC